MTVTEASRNFAAAAKAADKSSTLFLTKNGKDRYALMNIEKYNELTDKTRILGKRNDEICCIEINAEQATVYQILEDPEFEGFAALRVCELPMEVSSLTITGRKIVFTSSIDAVRASGGKLQATFLFREGNYLTAQKDAEEAVTPREKADYISLIRAKDIISEFKRKPEHSIYRIELEVTKGSHNLMEEFF